MRRVFRVQGAAGGGGGGGGRSMDGGRRLMSLDTNELRRLGKAPIISADSQGSADVRYVDDGSRAIGLLGRYFLLAL